MTERQKALHAARIASFSDYGTEGSVKIAYELPEDRDVTIAIDGPDGVCVRNLFGQYPRAKGAAVDWWNCLDDDGNRIQASRKNYTYGGHVITVGGTNGTLKTGCLCIDEGNESITNGGFDLVFRLEKGRRSIPDAMLDFSGSWYDGFGGFHYALGRPADEAAKNPLWQELYVRWMQLGAFLPMMRSHGMTISREIYLHGQKGEPVYDSLVSAIRLRYALMPYIYSTAWRCCADRYTMMRALLMDFPADPVAVRCTDEFMFGGAFLVAPVLDHAVTGREVYLPAGTTWWNYFTEREEKGGRTFFVRTPMEAIPVYVRAGSIVPIGLDVQYNGEKPWDDLEIRIYPGADGSFTLYEDDFETYACERGERSEITFTWNDAEMKLTISEPKGKAFPGRLDNRRFRIRMPGHESVVVNYENRRVELSPALVGVAGLGRR